MRNDKMCGRMLLSADWPMFSDIIFLHCLLHQLGQRSGQGEELVRNGEEVPLVHV